MTFFYSRVYKLKKKNLNVWIPDEIHKSWKQK